MGTDTANPAAVTAFAEARVATSDLEAYQPAVTLRGRTGQVCLFPGVSVTAARSRQGLTLSDPRWMGADPVVGGVSSVLTGVGSVFGAGNGDTQQIEISKPRHGHPRSCGSG